MRQDCPVSSLDARRKDGGLEDGKVSGGVSRGR
jgi:hypothetical protein